MAHVVYLLGAGFNCSVLDSSVTRLEPPLAGNFFQMMLGAGGLREKLHAIREHLYVDELLRLIATYWHLSLNDLEAVPLDIEECLTFIESIARDKSGTDDGIQAARAAFALRGLLLGYLSDMSLQGASTPAGALFGAEVLANDSDVLTFNYDTIAEDAISHASGIGPNPHPPPLPADRHLRNATDEVSDEFLGVSHLKWKRTLACGFPFDEVALPVAGVTRYVSGKRYYAHDDNTLYVRHRVLKLHGSVDWLRYTANRTMPPTSVSEPAIPPNGLVQERFAHWWMGSPPTRGNWYMDPLIVPPLLFKEYSQGPLPIVWDHALETLSTCRVLVVIGYSFPPTDFRVRRLFLEAFSTTQHLEQLIVVNPDANTVSNIRKLAHYSGPVVTCDDLTRYYRVPETWFDIARPAPPAVPEEPRPDPPPGLR